MLFHVGVLMRLNELGMLPKLYRISSVSGGSITAGVLALQWSKLNFDANGIAANLRQVVVQPLFDFANVTVDEGAILGGLLTPGVSISNKVVAAYKKHLFGEATLQDLPDDLQKRGPRFVLNATSVQTGTLWRFSRPFMADYSVGMVRSPTLPLAVAVAASSAFPPFLSPLVYDFDATLFDQEVPPSPEFSDPQYRERLVLTDGGVYDNLGIETNWKRYRHILVSDAGQKMGGETAPKRDWPLHVKRVLDVVDNQVRSLRKRQIVEAFLDERDVHKGAYWSIRGDISEYPVERTEAADIAIGNACGHDSTIKIANVATRLASLSDLEKNHLANWGYAAADAGLRAWCGAFLKETYSVTLTAPKGWPFPNGVA